MRRRHSRRRVLGAAGAGLVGLAGCLGGPTGTTGGGDDDAADGTADGTTDGTTADAPTGGPPTAAALPLPSSPAAVREQAVSGGPPKDGIPAIEAPSFVAADVADAWVRDGDPVFGVAIGDTVKAYPQSILVLHEICNDVVDGEPASVTYCPLTGTAMGFWRGETSFGVSGRLVNNNLIMYDRATETWWPQVLATAVPGPWNAEPPLRSLSGFRVVWTTWERWRAVHPETRVLSRDTGFARNYGRDPYGGYNPRIGYYAPDARPMFPSSATDDRFPPKAVVIGARTPAGAVAFHKDRLREAGVMTGELAGVPHTAVHDPVLDTGYVYRNPDGLAVELVDGEVRTADGERHAPAALPLERVLALDAMWFAWNGFYPDSSVHG